MSVVRSGDRVFLHTAAATPRRLVEAMTARAGELSDVEVLSLHTEGEAPYAAPEHAASFRVNALFVGPNVRQAVDEGRGDFIPVFLSEIPQLLRSRDLRQRAAALTEIAHPDHREALAKAARERFGGV